MSGAATRGLALLEVLGYSTTGGAAESVLELSASFARAGHRVTIAAPDEPRFAARALAAGARFVPVAMASRRDFASLARLVALMRRERFDAIHTHCRNADLHGAIAARIAGRRAVVAHLRGLLVDGEGRVPGGLVDRAHRAALRALPRRIIAISDAVRRRALDLLALPPRRIVTVRNGVAVARFAAPRADGAALRGELRVPAGAPLLVSIGTLGRCKAQDLLLGACARLESARPIVALAGPGDDATRAALAALAGRLDLADRVRFLGARDDVAALLHAADLVVHAPRWEGFGRVAAEAMAAGRPLVATRVGGLGEIVEDGVTGRLVAANDETELARAIDELLADRGRAEALGVAAARFAAAELDSEATARGVARVLADAAEATR